MDDLLELNRIGLHNKLDLVPKRTNGDTDEYAANDLITVLSTNVERDKRMISDWSSNLVKIHRMKRSGYTRLVRFFTMEGISEYLAKGKVFAYKNACDYFSIDVVDKTHIQWSKEIDDMKINDLYKTHLVLKWLFGKRKTTKLLGVEDTLEKIIDYAKTIDGYSDEKMAFLSTK